MFVFYFRSPRLAVYESVAYAAFKVEDNVRASAVIVK